MSINISGGMIIGADAAEVKSSICRENDDVNLYGTDGNLIEEFYDWYEDVGMSIFSDHYDCDTDYQVVGFTVKAIDVLSSDFADWVEEVEAKAEEFYKLTGIKPKLIGMQNVW